MGLIGNVIDNDFKIIKRIGFGGDSEVYLAVQLSAMKRKCAIKLYREPCKNKDGEMTPFKRERMILSIVNTDLVPALFRTGLYGDNNRPYIAMEFISGSTLSDILQKNQVFELDFALQILQRMVEGINEFHINQIIHRDIKPSNIFIVPKWENHVLVKIIDFSHSKLSFESENRWADHESEFVGTFNYMPPEQAFSKPTNPTSDIFSLALVFYEILTGVKAINLVKYGIDSYVDYLKGEFPIPTYSLGTFRPELPPALDYIIKKACSKEQKDRYQNVTDFYNAVFNALNGRLNSSDVKTKKEFSIFNIFGRRKK